MGPLLLERIGHHQHPAAARRRGPHRRKKRWPLFSFKEARRARHPDHTDRINPQLSNRCGLGRIPQATDLQQGGRHGEGKGCHPFLGSDTKTEGSGRRLANFQNPGNPPTDPPELVCDLGACHRGLSTALQPHPQGSDEQRGALEPGLGYGNVAVRFGAPARIGPLPGGPGPGGGGAQHHLVPARRSGQRGARVQHRPRRPAGGSCWPGRKPGAGRGPAGSDPSSRPSLAPAGRHGFRTGHPQHGAGPVQPAARPTAGWGPDCEGPGVAGQR